MTIGTRTRAAKTPVDSAPEPTLLAAIGSVPGTGPDPTMDLVLARVRIRAQRRAAWLRKLWAGEGEPGGTQAVTHGEMDTHLADLDAPDAEWAWQATDEASAFNRELIAVEAALALDDSSRLASLTRIFTLGQQDVDVLHGCLALALDPSIARIFAYLHDHAGRPYASDALLARLFDYGRAGVWRTDLALRRWELVVEREVASSDPLRLVCDPVIVEWLRGHEGLDDSLVDCSRLTRAREPLSEWPVEEAVAWIEDIVRGNPSGHVRVQLVGPPGSGRRTLAATIAAALGLSALAIDTDQFGDQDWRRVHLRAQRQAFLDRRAPVWHGEGIARRWPASAPQFPVQFVVRESGQPIDPVSSLVERVIDLPRLGVEEQRRLWREHVPSAAVWPVTEFDALVKRHRVTVGQIAAAAAHRVESPHAASVAVREGARDRLGKLAQRMESAFGWEDLVVYDHIRAALDDLRFEAEEQALLWDRPEARRLFPQGRGLLALFSGPPGTGKTMAAQVVASELGLDLYRIDLSAVVSKYVGESSKNLEQILSRAEHTDVVLLFDEADALFGKRTDISDAHDRFANTDTSYLLQAIESYRGIAILSTNKKGNIDPGFMRRFRYVIDYPRPDAAQRLTLWRKLVGELNGEALVAQSASRNGHAGALDDGIARLASRLDLSGAQIKYAILAGLFAARREERPLALKHLLHGVDRELMKEGRALGKREREGLVDHGA